MKLLQLLFVAFFSKSIYSQSCSGPDYGSDITISGPCPPYIAIPYINTPVQFICSYVFGPGKQFLPYLNVTGFLPIPSNGVRPPGLSVLSTQSTTGNGTTGSITLIIDILHFNMTDILNIQCGLCSICNQPSFQSAIETTQPVQLIIFGKYILYIIN